MPELGTRGICARAEDTVAVGVRAKHDLLDEKTGRPPDHVARSSGCRDGGGLCRLFTGRNA